MLRFMFLACLAMFLVSCGRREELVNALPHTPDLGSAHTLLQKRVASAEEQVRSGDDPLNAFIELSRLYHANGYLPEAVACYEYLLKRQPEEPRWPHLLAFVLAGYGHLEDALPLWERVGELAPAYVPAKVRRADALLKLNRLDEAETAYEQVLQDETRNPYVHLGLGRIAMARAEFVTARRHLEDAARFSDNRIGADVLVTVYEQLGLDHLALDLRSRAKASGSYSDIPDPWLNDLLDDCYDAYQLVSAGGFAAFAGNADRGIELLERALVYAPDDYMAHFQLADLYSSQGKSVLAREHFRRSREIRPNFADAWLREILILRQGGYDSLAEELFYEALAHNQDSPGMHLEHGILLYRRSDYTGAEKALKKSIQLRPNEPYAYMQLAAVYLRMERLDDGIEQLELALRAEPSYPGALTSLASIYIGIGEQGRAREIMEMIQRQPRIPADEVERLTERYNAAFELR